MGMYELHIYGGKNIERTKDQFDTEKEAMNEAEYRATDDNRGWKENKNGEMVLVDDNHSDDMEDLVIHKVYEISE